MTTDYASRLQVPLTGDDTTVFTSLGGLKLAVGYLRVVIGKRGPYVEFSGTHLLEDTFDLVEKPHRYFIEYRSRDGVMLYEQLEPVDYADYLPGNFYISPFDLRVGGVRVIEELKHG